MRYAMILCVCATIAPGFAGGLKSGDIPAQVMSTFKTACQKAEDVHWKTKGENFKVNYECNDADMSMIIDPDGNLLEKVTDIKSTGLPAGTVEVLSTRYPGFKIRESEKVERNGTIEYEVDLAKKAEVILNASGNLIRESVENDADENEREDDDHE